MITIAKYSNIADAQKDADRIASRGIEVILSHGEMAGVIGGNQPSFSLQVYEEDLEILEGIREDVLAEIVEDNPYNCPACQSKDYEWYQPKAVLLKSIFSPRSIMHGYKHYKCNSCGGYFKVKSSE